jgi:hypothetical protein
VTIECRQRGQSVGFHSRLAYRRPADLRLTANILGNPAVDLGCNEQESWLWCSKKDPPGALVLPRANRGKVRWPLPFAPDALLPALGMAEHAPTARVGVRYLPDTVELAEETTSPQGQPLRQITIFRRASHRSPVTNFRVEDEAGKVVYSVTIAETWCDRHSGAVLPRRLQMEWPSEQFQLRLTLEEITVNPPMEGASAAGLFKRPVFPGDAKTGDRPGK